MPPAALRAATKTEIVEMHSKIEELRVHMTAEEHGGESVCRWSLARAAAQQRRGEHVQSLLRRRSSSSRSYRYHSYQCHRHRHCRRAWPKPPQQPPR